MGASPPIVEMVERDDAYIAEMLARGRQFMHCVVARRPPVHLPAVPPPIDAHAVYDMVQNNTWAHHAHVWLTTRAQAEACKDAEKTLKFIVPPDAKKCHGHGIQITRDRAGRLSLREIAK